MRVALWRLLVAATVAFMAVIVLAGCTTTTYIVVECDVVLNPETGEVTFTSRPPGYEEHCREELA